MHDIIFLFYKLKSNAFQSHSTNFILGQELETLERSTDQVPNNLLPKSMNKYYTYIFESSVIIIELEMTIIKSMIDISNQNSEV